MKKQLIIYGIVGLVIGVILTSFTAAYAVNNDRNGMMRVMGIQTNTNSQGMMNNKGMSMGEMTSTLKNKTGDDFDKAFIEQMIIHHQGAITMAELTQSNAKHSEIKQLGNDIIKAQTSEIDMMQTWQSAWGYTSTSNTGSSNDMSNMGH